MRIVCLGWGSLIWKPQPLELVGDWRPDGPLLPIEFARESDGGELATALAPGADDVPVWWAPLAATTVDAAREALREREKIPAERTDGIGSVVVERSGAADAPGDPIARRILDWARAKPCDAVVWTALPPRSQGVEGRMPTVDEAYDYLHRLTPADVRAHAEHYVRSVPRALRTRYRPTLEARLGWTPDDA